MRFYQIIFLIFFLTVISFPQTSEYGNIKIYTREPHLSSFGYYTGSHRLPSFTGNSRLDYNGISYTSDYDLTNIGNIVFGNNSEFRVTLDGIFRIGIGLGNTSLIDSLGKFPDNNVKYYQASIDFFTLKLNPEYTLIFKHGYSVTIYFGIDLINIGVTGSFLDGGEVIKHSVAQANILPIAFRPGVFFDFGNSGLGIGAYINPTNILAFRYTSEELYPDDKWGFKSFDNFFKRYEFQIIFTF